MEASAIVDQAPSRHATHGLPVPAVWCEGMPLTHATVCEVTRFGRFDERSAVIALGSPVAASALIGRMLTVVQPLQFASGGDELHVLCMGQARMEGHRSVRLVDPWTSTLDAPVNEAVNMRAGFAVGRAANRSHATQVVRGRQVYVPQVGGVNWSLGDALRTLFVWQGFALNLDSMSATLRDAPLTTSVVVRGSLRQVLTQLLAGYAVRMERYIHWLAGEANEKPLQCVGVSDGARVRMTWPDDSGSGGDVLKAHRVTAPAARATRLVVTAPPHSLEASIHLAPTWDTELDGEDAEEYQRHESGDFARYRNVYRLWSTNFDGRFQTAAGPLPMANVDLAALFSDTAIDPSHVALSACLVLDDVARPREPVVEYSTDGGLSWSIYPGRVIVRLGEGTVYLDDDVLPAAYFDSAVVDGVIVRLTATLIHSARQRAERWFGDVHHSRGDVRLQHADCFQWRSVSDASRHADGVAAGTLVAATIDDRAAMEQWLLDRVDADAQPNEHVWQVELAGAWPLLKPGDVLLDAGGPGMRLDGMPQATHSGGAIVDSVRTVWVTTSDAATHRPRSYVRCLA